jgi:hypothetical protein
MKFVRQITTKTLTLGQPETISIPRNYAIRNLALKLKGSITISGGTTSGIVKDSSPLQLLTNLRVRRDGKDTLISIPAVYLHRLNQILYGTRPQITSLANGDAQSDTAVSAGIIIPFENLRGVKPFDTLLKGAGLSSLDLLLDVASSASVLVQGGDRTIAVGSTPFTLDVMSIEEIGVNNFIFGDIRTYLAHKVSVSGASDSFQIKPIAVGNRYKGFLLVVEDDSALSNSIIDHIKLKSGSEVFVDANAESLQWRSKTEYQLESLPTGYYYINLMPDGMLNQTLDVGPKSGRETLEFDLKVNAPGGTCYIYVIALEYIPAAVVVPNSK